MKRLPVVLALAALPVMTNAQSSPTPAPAPAADVSGTWDIVANIAGNPIEMQCTLTQKNTDLTGTCTSQQQTALPIAGTLDGKKVGWQFDSAYEGQTLTVVYSGTIETSEKIVGSVDVQPMSVSGDFTATKTKPTPAK
jgi:hypothetical protein